MSQPFLVLCPTGEGEVRIGNDGEGPPCTGRVFVLSFLKKKLFLHSISMRLVLMCVGKNFRVTVQPSSNLS